MAGQFPSPVIVLPITGAVVPGVKIPTSCIGGCHLGLLAIVPRAHCSHLNTMCGLCIPEWERRVSFLVKEGDPEFDQAIDMLERVA